MGLGGGLSVIYLLILLFGIRCIGFFSETGECFLEECPNNKRDRTTLEALILKRVRLGTKILTDGWAGYKQLEKLGLPKMLLNCLSVVVMMIHHF